MTWDEVCANPYLQDLPFDIETNRWGQIVMSPPPHNDHRFAQSSIYDLLKKKLRGGEALPEGNQNASARRPRLPSDTAGIRPHGVWARLRGK